MKVFSTLAVSSLSLLALQVTAAQLDAKVDVQSGAGGNVSATLTITNNGQGTEKILRWYTDLEEEKIFHILRDGVEVEFMGPHYKRHAPTEKDFIKLKPGQSLNRTFELTSLYDMSEAGNYEISYDVSSLHLFNHDQVSTQDNGIRKQQDMTVESLSSGASYLWLDGVQAKGLARVSKKPGGSTECIDGTCFSGRCSNSEKNSIFSALDAAEQMANDAVAYLSSHSASNTSARYETWFGQATNSRYNTAVSNFDAINDAIDNESITFDCSCNQSYFAYVYPNQPYKVYLCRAFWSARETGTDSRAGTIIHELSHFNVVAGTDDVVYGQSGAKSLAISNPNQALNNADSHEYFAENTPYQN
ncbi:peptidase M35 [Thalassomonas viridans]|uniref:Peptidase M35 n=1 Tax=Thalassomonas viridans TaxID=137584 RepID=A0AAF0CAQ3_9GAMM|nr:M35 family metallo-endopeptidase [Thalassomonas viridans]WDE06781.1 peptidase M35 [Thalassomonas viridans]